MAKMNSDLKSMGLLMLGLLVLVIIVGVIFLVSDTFLGQLCNQASTGAVYDGTQCLNATGGSALSPQPTSVTQTEYVIASVVLAISFLAIIVIVAIAKIILRVTRGMGGGN